MGFEEDLKRRDLKSIVIGSVVGALGFLVAFSWRDFIQHVLNTFIPEGDSLAYQLLATIFITILAFVIGYALIKLSEKSIVEKFKRKNPYKPAGKVSVKPI